MLRGLEELVGKEGRAVLLPWLTVSCGEAEMLLEGNRRGLKQGHSPPNTVSLA